MIAHTPSVMTLTVGPVVATGDVTITIPEGGFAGEDERLRGLNRSQRRRWLALVRKGMDPDNALEYVR